MRLIDADKMLLELDCERRMSCDGCRFSPDEDGLCIHDKIEEWVNAQPTVEVGPVRHGHWIQAGEVDGNGNADYLCSSCYCRDNHAESVSVPYCWHCGAKMDGGVEHEAD